MSEQTHQTALGEVRIVALSRIAPGKDFNPRQARDPELFAQLLASVKADGVLQPLLVTPDSDGFRLIAGEGRWLAAGEAGQTEVPVHIVAVDERTGGLELAMAENLARQDIDPVQEAHGYERLRDAGLTKKGIAERLGVAQRRVTDRLELLKLPEGLHPRIATGQTPPAAIKPLVALERIHSGLAECAVARIDAPSGHAWEEPLSWADLVADPVGVLTAHVEGPGTELPDGVYEAGEPVRLCELPLTDAAREQLSELCELLGQPVEEAAMRFGREALERAMALKAAHAAKSGWAHLIVGNDVVGELAAEHIASCLEQQRAIAVGPQSGGTDAHEATTTTPDGDAGAVSAEDRAKEERRAQRAEEERERAAAVAHNTELGAAILKHLARLKVDVDVLKVLTSVEVAGDIDGVAARGARYAFPGWMTEVAQKNGKVKVEYLDKPAAGAKAREFLACADTVAEIAGRLVCLIAAARYADERAVARSNRSFSSLSVRSGLPYSGDVLDLIDELCAQRLPDHLTAAVRDARRQQREAQAEREAELAAARARLDAARANVEGLGDKQRAQALQDVETIHGPYSLEAHRLRKQLQPAEPAAADGGRDAEESASAEADGDVEVAAAA